MRKGICIVLALGLAVLAAACGPVKPAAPADGAMALEKAVSKAVLDRGRVYLNGEVLTEGHIIFETEEKDGQVVVYASTGVGWFGFENGVFTKISGSGAIPAVLTFARDRQGGYALQAYKVPDSGADEYPSMKRLFPERLWDKAWTDSYKRELNSQQEAQAAAYLKSIGREARVSAAHVKKELAKIDVRAANRLLALATKEGLLNRCPYWLGTREWLEDGTRYVYEKRQDKSDDGYDVIIYRKTRENGTVVEERTYKIVGSEPQLVSQVGK